MLVGIQELMLVTKYMLAYYAISFLSMEDWEAEKLEYEQEIF